MNKNSTKNFKVFTLILLTSMLLLVAIIPSVPSVKAATTTTLFLYTTLGTQSITANGTAMTLGASNTFTSGNTEKFQATASSGFQFLCFIYADASGPAASTDNPYTRTISAACSLEAVFVPTSNTTATTSGSGTSTLTIFATSGGTTSPAGKTSGASVSATIGHSTTITQTPGTGFKFLCWVVQCSSSNEYTSSSLTYTPTSNGAAIEAIWVPSSSTVTLPTPTPTATATPKPVSISTDDAIIIAVVVVIVVIIIAVGVFAYTKRTKKEAKK
ncbi:MAG: hypothetical protein ABSC20_12280 [Candidatus Bathyarchaeia archaeon]